MCNGFPRVILPPRNGRRGSVSVVGPRRIFFLGDWDMINRLWRAAWRRVVCIGRCCWAALQRLCDRADNIRDGTFYGIGRDCHRVDCLLALNWTGGTKLLLPQATQFVEKGKITELGTVVPYAATELCITPQTLLQVVPQRTQRTDLLTQCEGGLAVIFVD